jgi:hypothetical protein
MVSRLRMQINLRAIHRDREEESQLPDLPVSL